MFEYFLILLSTVIALVVYYLINKNRYWKIRGVPGPKPVLLFGNIKNVALRKENIAVTLKKAYDEFPDEPFVGIYRMTSPCILLRDLDLIKHVMIKDFDKFEDRGVEYSKEGLGANLFHADNETWRALRYKFTPLFTTGKLKNMMYLINEKCDIIIRYIDKLTMHKSEHEVLRTLRRYTTSTIVACAFGLEVDTLSEPLMNTLLKIDNLTLSCNIFHEIDMMFPGVLKKIKTDLFPTDVSNFFKNMVSDIISKRNGVPCGRNDFIDLMLEMRQQGAVQIKKKYSGKDSEDIKFTLTESVMAAQVFVFYIGGSETSATVLSYLLYELAVNPKIQDKLIEEVDDVLQEHNGKITYETIANNPYMEKVFNETYRKYPVVPIFRKSNSDYNVPGTDFTMKKDTVVLVSALGIHYDEKLYPDPHKFDPDRFSPENEKDRHSCAYLPFGVGPRNCLGIRFAKLQTRIFAMKFFSKYQVEPSEKTTNPQIEPNRLLVCPLNGIHVNIIPRKKNQ